MATKVLKPVDSRNSQAKTVPKNNTSESPKSGVPLDTLAQLGTNEKIILENKTKSSDKKALLKRARRKYFTGGLVKGLVAASEKSNKSVLTQAYWKTWHCSSNLTKYENGNISGKFCKRRWCMVCNAIRTAKSIIKYRPIIDEWGDAHFITLTQEVVTAADLPHQLNTMHNILKSIQENVKRQNQRGKCDYKLTGIRKLECTYRPNTDKYHPHFHLIVENKTMGERIIKEWMERNTKAGIKVNRAAQDIRKTDSKACIELFKYMTKVVASTGNKTSEKGERLIYANGLDVIFNALHGRRVLQPFGFKAPKVIIDDGSKENEHQLAISVLEWHQDCSDWYDKATGEGLTGYVPVEGMKELVTNKIIY